MELIESKQLVVEFAKKTKFIETSPYEKIGIHFPDSLNVAIALEEHCDCIITFNIKDFEVISDKIAIFEPSQI